MSKNYIRLDVNNCIIDGFSSDFKEPLESDVIVGENGNGYFELYGIISPTLFNSYGQPLYKYINDKIISLTSEEQNTLYPVTQEPTMEIKNRADIDYILIMQGL